MYFLLQSYSSWFIITYLQYILLTKESRRQDYFKSGRWWRFVLDPKMSRILMMNYLHSRQLKCFVWPLQTSPRVPACFPHFLKMLFMELSASFLGKKSINSFAIKEMLSSNLDYFQPWWNFKETTGSSIYWDNFVMLWWWSVGPLSGVIRLEDDQSWRLPGSDPLGLFSVVMILWCLLTKLRCQ